MTKNWRTIYDHTNQKIKNEFAAILETKDPRPFESLPCPTCGRIGGFLRNDDGSLYPDCCIPCAWVVAK